MEDSPRWVAVVQEQEAEIARLTAENARLRAALDDARATAERLAAEHAALMEKLLAALAPGGRHVDRELGDAGIG